MARLAETDKSSDAPTLTARAFRALADSSILPVIWHAESRYLRVHTTASELLRKELARTRIDEENSDFTERTKLSMKVKATGRVQPTGKVNIAKKVKFTERTKLPQPPTSVVISNGPAKIDAAANHSAHPDACSLLNASKACGGASVRINASGYLLTASARFPAAGASLTGADPAGADLAGKIRMENKH
jgi:hypothetical protein